MKFTYKDREFEAEYRPDQSYGATYAFSGKLPEWVDRDETSISYQDVCRHNETAWPRDTIVGETENRFFFYAFSCEFDDCFQLTLLAGGNKRAIAKLRELLAPLMKGFTR